MLATKSNAITATKSNAIKATRSDAFYIASTSLKNSSGGWESFTSTVDLTAVKFQVVYKDGSTESQYLSSSGDFNISNDSKYIERVLFYIPRSHLPSSGTFNCHAACYCNAGATFNSVTLFSSDKATGAEEGYKAIVSAGGFEYNYASWYLDPVDIDFRSFNRLIFRCDCDPVAREVQGRFYLRYSMPVGTSTVVDAGNVYDQGSLADKTAQNTAAIVESQNETNGILEDMIQHISDQLHALWDQLYNIAFVPWKDQQHADAVDIQSSIDEQIENDDANTETVTNAIEQHGNFIIEGLKSLFIPSEDYFPNAVADLQSYFEGKLGALGYGFTWCIDLLNGIRTQNAGTIIRFPGISVPNVATGETYVICKPRGVDLKAQMEQVTFGSNVVDGQSTANLYQLCKFVGNLMLTLGMINLVMVKLREIEEK